MVTTLVMAIFATTVLVAQDRHYKFKSKDWQWSKTKELHTELESKLKEFDDVKRKVDTLVVKAGFRA